MTDLTVLQVQEALDREPEIDASGRPICQICSRPFEKRGQLGVHQLVHRRAVGLAPPMVSGRGKAAPKMVDCRYEGCVERLVRASLPSHLMGRHGMTRSEASFYGRKRRDEDVAYLEALNGQPPTEEEALALNEAFFAREAAAAKQKAKAKRKPKAKVLESLNGDAHQPPPFTDSSAVELVTGILTSVRPDGQIPMRLLPVVIDLISHVEAVLGELDKP